MRPLSVSPRRNKNIRRSANICTRPGIEKFDEKKKLPGKKKKDKTGGEFVLDRYYSPLNFLSSGAVRYLRPPLNNIGILYNCAPPPTPLTTYSQCALRVAYGDESRKKHLFFVVRQQNNNEIKFSPFGRPFSSRRRVS